MDLIDDLAAIGFTEYEARVYLALLSEHPATGYQVSKRAGVPRSMVYEALGRLDARGAVLKSEERRATLYRPVPPDNLLDRYLDEHRSRIRRMRSGLEALFTAQVEEHVWEISGRPATLALARQMMAEAGTELLAVLSDPDLEALQDDLRSAAGRDVTVGSLLTGSGSLDIGQVAHHPPLESELQELTGMLVVVADIQQVLIAGPGERAPATVTKNRNLVLIARQFVWMELFAQRVYARLGPELLARLDPEDRRILEVYARKDG